MGDLQASAVYYSEIGEHTYGKSLTTVPAVAVSGDGLLRHGWLASLRPSLSMAERVRGPAWPGLLGSRSRHHDLVTNQRTHLWTPSDWGLGFNIRICVAANMQWIAVSEPIYGARGESTGWVSVSVCGHVHAISWWNSHVQEYGIEVEMDLRQATGMVRMIVKR